MLKHKHAQKYTIEFIVIGSVAAFLFRALYEIFFSQFNTLIFFFGFGFIGLALGIYYSIRIKIFDNSYLNYLITPITFMLCGIAFSLWLHILFATNLINIEKQGNFGLFLIPGSVGIFVYIFSTLYISLENKPEILGGSVLLSSLIVFFVSGVSLRYSDGTSPTTLIAIGLVSYLVVLFLFYTTILYHYIDYVENMTFDIVLLFGSFAFFPVYGIAGILLFPLIDIYFALVLVKRYFEKTKKETEHFDKKITTSFEWLFAIPSVFMNTTLILFPFAIIPYVGITNTLLKTNLLSRKNLRRTISLGLFSFIVYVLFFLGYKYLFFSSNSITTKLPEFIYWGLIGAIGSTGLGYSLIYKGSHE